MRYYNERRRHDSIKYMVPNKFYEAFMSNTVNIEAFSAQSPKLGGQADF
jgi:putative transposase